MTHGIQLKHLKNADLSAPRLDRESHPEHASSIHPGLLAETNPMLSGLVGEVREGLERILALLEQALEETRGGKPRRNAD